MVTTRKYKVIKITRRDDCDSGLKINTLGYFKSKKAAMDFANYNDNVEMWRNEYKTIKSIITLEIDVQQCDEEDGVSITSQEWCVQYFD